VPLKVAAKSSGVPRASISCARLVLSQGTDNEIKGVLDAKLGLLSTAKVIRKRASSDALNELRNHKRAWGEDNNRRENHRARTDLWAKLGPALRSISELPDPLDMVKVIKANHARVSTLNEYLPKAMMWLTEFSNVWK
jgi:hypothetical protein